MGFPFPVGSETSVCDRVSTNSTRTKTNLTNGNEPAIDYRLAEQPLEDVPRFCFCSLLFVQFVFVRAKTVPSVGVRAARVVKEQWNRLGAQAILSACSAGAPPAPG
jgi:hypothetical protein